MRDLNEDAIATDSQFGFVVVADGIGGAAAGEIASDMAVNVVRESLQSFLAASESTSRSELELVEGMKSSIVAANDAVWNAASSHSEWRGMGSTVAVAAVRGSLAVVGSSGDSRVYLCRDQKISQLTHDHTAGAVAERFFGYTEDAGQVLNAEEKTPLAQALGKDPALFMPSASVVSLRKDDRLIACTDGLTDLVSDGRIAALASMPFDDPAELCRSLVIAGEEAGGTDNISVAMIVIDSLEPPPKKTAALSAVAFCGLVLAIVVILFLIHRYGASNEDLGPAVVEQTSERRERVSPADPPQSAESRPGRAVPMVRGTISSTGERTLSTDVGLDVAFSTAASPDATQSQPLAAPQRSAVHLPGAAQSSVKKVDPKKIARDPRRHSLSQRADGGAAAIPKVPGHSHHSVESMPATNQPVVIAVPADH